MFLRKLFRRKLHKGPIKLVVDNISCYASERREIRFVPNKPMSLAHEIAHARLKHRPATGLQYQVNELAAWILTCYFRSPAEILIYIDDIGTAKEILFDTYHLTELIPRALERLSHAA